MGFKINSSSVHARLSKMKATIKNIAFLAATSNLAVNQLMECEVAMAVIAKVAFVKEPK
jgi:hypothetical protein